MNWLSFTTKRLPLLNLPPEIVAALRTGKLEYTKAAALARIKDESERKQLLSKALANDWSLSEIKEQIKTRTHSAPSPSTSPSTSLPDRLKDTYQRIKKQKLWEDPDKVQQLENALSQLETLLDNN